MIWPLVLVLLASCSLDEQDARRHLDAYGFTDIKLHGYQWTGCGRDDLFNTGFTALNVHRRPVAGTVCCGSYKNCTVRLR